MVDEYVSPAGEFFSDAPVGVIMISVLTGRIVDINRYICELLGREPEEVLGNTGYDSGLWPRDVGQRVVQMFLDARLSGAGLTKTVEQQIPHRDGHLIDMMLSVHQVQYYGEACVMVVGLDISRLKQAEALAEASEARLRQLVNTVDAVLWEANPSGRRYTFMSERAQTLTGRSAEFWLKHGELWGDMIHPVDRGRVYESRDIVLLSGITQEIEYRIIRDDGIELWVRESTRPEYNEKGEIVGILGVWLDISHLMGMQQSLQNWADELDQAKKAAQYAADHDGLTELLNRRAWIDRLEEYDDWRAVAIVDIDYFKKVNDTFGHPAGDHVLREVAWRIGGIVGTAGVVGRLGGEEFAIAFTVPAIQATQLADQIVEMIARLPVVLPDARELRVTVSAGLSGRPPGSTVLAVYELADRSLYIAKQSGRNRVATGPGGLAA